MATQRAHIVLPQDLVSEIDAIVGPRGRSAFIVETAREALRRRALLDFLKRSGPSPAWKDEDHPELAEGAAVWVKGLRAENKPRALRAEKARKSR